MSSTPLRNSDLSAATGLQCALETVQDGQKCLHGVRKRILAEFLLFARGPLACILELGLQTGQAVQQAYRARLSVCRTRIR